jgi:hypothetical protein
MHLLDTRRLHERASSARRVQYSPPSNRIPKLLSHFSSVPELLRRGWRAGMNVSDFVVIGAGIAGASVAAELSRDHSVALLEAEYQPGYHATGRSAALFSEIYGNRTVRGLIRASRPYLFDPPAAFAGAPFTRPRSSMFVAAAPQLEALGGIAGEDDTRALTRELDAEATRALCPELRRSYLRAGLYEPGAADIDVHCLRRAYLRQLQAQGGCLVTLQRVEAVDQSGNQMDRIGQSHQHQRGRAQRDGCRSRNLVPFAGVEARDRQRCIAQIPGAREQCRDAEAVQRRYHRRLRQSVPAIHDEPRRFSDRPIDPQQFFANIQTNPMLYDVVARMFYAGVRFRW